MPVGKIWTLINLCKTYFQGFPQCSERKTLTVMLYRKHLNALTELNTDQMLLQQVAPLRSQVWCVNVNEFITVTFSIHFKFLHRLQKESKQEINVVSNFVLTENVTLCTIIIIEVKLYKEKAKCYICVFLNSFVEFLDTIMKVFLALTKLFLTSFWNHRPFLHKPPQ